MNQTAWPVGPEPVFLTTDQSDLPSPLKSTGALPVGGGVLAVVSVKFDAATEPVSPDAPSRKRSVHVPLALVTPVNCGFIEVTAAGLVVGPGVVVRYVPDGIGVVAAAVHQFVPDAASLNV